MAVNLNVFVILMVFLSGCGSSTNKVQKPDNDVNKR